MLLYNTMLVFGAGISDGDRHNHDDLPILLAGKGGGTIKLGRHVVYPNQTPLTNLSCRCSTGWACVRRPSVTARVN
jgi:hypothetical protein